MLALATNAAQFFVLQGFLENPGLGVREFALQDDVRPAAGDLFRDFVRRKMQAAGEKRDERGGVVDQRRRRPRPSRPGRFAREPRGGLVNRAALRRDDVASDIFFRGQLAVVIVHHHLEMDQPIGKDAEEQRENNTNQRAAGSAIPLHCPPRWLATGWRSSSPAERAGEFSLTMFCSVIGIILR